jgi:hypothetical protein
MTRRERRRAYAVTAVVLLAVAWPAVSLVRRGDRAADGFPISTYPMFTHDPGRVVDVPTVIGVRADGSITRLTPTQSAGTDQVIQAYVAVRGAIDDGAGASLALCRRAADRLDPGGAVVTVEVAMERYDAVKWSAGARAPISRTVAAVCPVDR